MRHSFEPGEMLLKMKTLSNSLGQFAKNVIIVQVFVGGLLLAAKKAAVVPGGPSEPIRYIGSAQVNTRLADGWLPWAVGVQSYQVLRATRLYPNLSDGQGWTFHHAPALAYWRGKFYAEFIASPLQENGLPTNVMMSTSTDGRNWSMPEVVFPQWNSYKDPLHPVRSQLHQRMGFYVAPNGRLLVISHYGLWDNEKNHIFGGPGHVVREIHRDGTLGPIYFVRYGKGWTASNTPYPNYKESPDEVFVKACDALLANSFVTDQWFELEKGYPPNAYIKIEGNYRPDISSSEADQHRKALSFFHRKDGVAVGIWKKAWTAISSDGGKTWSTPVQAPGFAHTFAKLWGQRTSDGRYAIAYDPQGRCRWPLAVVTSDDGVTFNHMLVVEGEVPFRRYPGFAKDNGPQYVRGIAEGNPQPPDGAMWLVYSMNKEDIWVSRIQVPIRGNVTHAVHDTFNNLKPDGVVTNWNIYSPRWAPVEVVNFPSTRNRSLELRDGDPYDYARAVRVFPVSRNGEIGFKVFPRQTDGELDIELDSIHGRRPVRITLARHGEIEIANGSEMTKAGSYAPNKWLAFKIDFDADRENYSVAIDGQLVVRNASFAEPVQSLQRVSFRTGPHRMVSIDQCGSGRGNDKYYYVGHINPETDRPLKNPAVFYLDNVWSENQR
jgi:Sialidase-like, CBM domain